MSELVQLRRRRTESRWSKRELAAEAARIGPMSPDEAPPRPTRRADCVDGPRPCPWVSCRHHLGLDVTKHGSITITCAVPPFSSARSGTLPMYDEGVDLEAMEDTCALDVADRGEHTLEQIGALLGLTRERLRQLEEDALARVAEARPDLVEASCAA